MRRNTLSCDAVVHLQGFPCENKCTFCRYAKLGSSTKSAVDWSEAIECFENVEFRGAEPLLWPDIFKLLRFRDRPGDIVYTHLPWDGFCALRQLPPQKKLFVAVFHPLAMGGNHQFVSFYDRAWRLADAGYNVQVLSRVPVTLHPELANSKGWDPSPMGVEIVYRNQPVYDFLTRKNARKRCPSMALSIAPDGNIFSCEHAMLYSREVDSEAVVLGSVWDDEELEQEACRINYCTAMR